ncbi:MAG TPA: 1-deoxy-D-xylulose-5-phosphate reductoisomerase [Ignavibacteria bacterium]|nr:1-deoxy-D-xylulose-5-phosphate reductoisomerase [Ignavibacteria bacterium]HMQ99157.1 1-deoxy-D-xylulose-5-phosphate reductoisomerase [Ignavibacteria bacterium]
MKNIAVLGSTGSIGRNTLEVVRNLNRNGYPVSVKYISANSNVELLSEQIEEFKPKAAVIFNETSFNDLKSRSLNHKCEILCGQQGINEIASRDDFELVVNALVGFSGLIPTIEAIKHGKDIALANKESLVVAGELIYSMLRESKSHLLPIDSEHSAILQCLQGEPIAEVSRLILTASGGPFRELTKEEMNSVTVAQALKHPNWVMGNKITIDSATLMNKGFEIIEAKWLFNIEAENIDVLIHPQSVIHSMVEFTDGSVKAQLGVPDMKVPIQYALTYPGRIKSDFPRIDFKQLKNLTFDEPDLEKFECLKLAYDVIKSGGSYPIVLNGANEAAIDLFLKEKIRFTDIPALIKSAMDKHENHVSPSLENIVSIDSWSRKFVYDSATELV